MKLVLGIGRLVLGVGYSMPKHPSMGRGLLPSAVQISLLSFSTLLCFELSMNPEGVQQNSPGPRLDMGPSGPSSMVKPGV